MFGEQPSMTRRGLLGGAMAATSMACVANALPEDEAPPGGHWFTVTQGAALAALRLLAGLPYISIGRGQPVYVMTSARCPNCQGMYRQYPGEVPGLEVRYIPIPFTFDESGEIARLWQSRSPALFEAYLQHRLVGTPPIRTSTGARIASAPTGLNDFFGQIFSRIQEVGNIFARAFPSTFTVGTPMFYYGTGDKMVGGAGNRMPFLAYNARRVLLSLR